MRPKVKVVFEVLGPPPCRFRDLAAGSFFRFAEGNSAGRSTTGLRRKLNKGRYSIVDDPHELHGNVFDPMGFEDCTVIPLDVTITVHGPLPRETES